MSGRKMLALSDSEEEDAEIRQEVSRIEKKKRQRQRHSAKNSLKNVATTGPPKKTGKRSKKRQVSSDISAGAVEATPKLDSDGVPAGEAGSSSQSKQQLRAEQMAAEQFESDLRAALQQSMHSDQKLPQPGKPVPVAGTAGTGGSKRKGKKGRKRGTSGSGPATAPSATIPGSERIHVGEEGQGASLLGGLLPKSKAETSPHLRAAAAPPGLFGHGPSGSTGVTSVEGLRGGRGAGVASSLASIEAEVQRALIADRLSTALSGGAARSNGSAVGAAAPVMLPVRNPGAGLPAPKPEEGGLDAAGVARLTRLLVDKEAALEQARAEGASFRQDRNVLRARLREAELRPRAELAELLEKERENSRELGEQLGAAAGDLSRAMSRVRALEGEIRRRGFQVPHWEGSSSSSSSNGGGVRGPPPGLGPQDGVGDSKGHLPKSGMVGSHWSGKKQKGRAAAGTSGGVGGAGGKKQQGFTAAGSKEAASAASSWRDGEVKAGQS